MNKFKGVERLNSFFESSYSDNQLMVGFLAWQPVEIKLFEFGCHTGRKKKITKTQRMKK